jgi:hypothetical protein
MNMKMNRDPQQRLVEFEDAAMGFADQLFRVSNLSETDNKTLAETLAAPVGEHLRQAENAQGTPKATAAAR